MGTMFRTTGPLTEKEAHLYVERVEDRAVATCVRRGDYVALIGSPQVGKTSLLLRLRRQLLSEGHIALYLDLSPAKDRDQPGWYNHLRTVMQEQLVLTASDLVVPPIQSQLDFRAALSHLSQHSFTASNQFVILLDEVGAVPEPVAELFFSTIRTVFNERDPIPAFRRCVFVMAGVFNPGELVKDPLVSPFNVAEHIYVGDADQLAVSRLARNLERLGFAVPEDVTARIYEWTGGHLYLTQCLCSCLERRDPTQLTVQDIDTAADQVLNDRHIQHVFKELDANLDVRGMIQMILSGDPPLHFHRSHSQMAKLELIGVIKADSKGYCTVRNRIYERVARNYVELTFGSIAELTPKEHELYVYFSRNINRTCPIHDIADAIWGPESFAEKRIENRVHSLVGRLRRKIEADPANTLRIVTVPGRGYKPQRER